MLVLLCASFALTSSTGIDWQNSRLLEGLEAAEAVLLSHGQELEETTIRIDDMQSQLALKDEEIRMLKSQRSEVSALNFGQRL